MRLFDLGRVVITPGALAAMEKAVVSPERLLERHAAGRLGGRSRGE